MLKYLPEKWKKKFFALRSSLIARTSKALLFLLFKTCRVHVEGVERFREIMTKEKCLLMLWHNRLALVPFILAKYTPHIQYAALVSASRDGEILSKIIHSYKDGYTIRVPHLARYQALQNVIRHVEERKQIVVITPDGPRGPRYEVKPGIAIAALETRAYVVSLNWEAKNYWEFKTWDQFRLPKPFTTVHVTFNSSLRFDIDPQPSLTEARAIITGYLPK